MMIECINNLEITFNGGFVMIFFLLMVLLICYVIVDILSRIN